MSNPTKYVLQPTAISRFGGATSTDPWINKLRLRGGLRDPIQFDPAYRLLPLPLVSGLPAARLDYLGRQLDCRHVAAGLSEVEEDYEDQEPKQFVAARFDLETLCFAV